MIEIKNIVLTRNDITSKDIPELKAVYGIDKLPLMPTKISFEIKNASTAVVNALRRTAINEMTGYALKIPNNGIDIEQTTDLFIIKTFVEKRVSYLRLKTKLPSEMIDKLRLSLDVTNETTSSMDVYASSLKPNMPIPIIFSPTVRLAFLQPGKRLVINDIYISNGIGRDNAIYNNACCCAYTHLDIEQYSDEDQRLKGGAAVDESGYKMSCMVADPRHHLFSAMVPATIEAIEAKQIIIDAAVSMKDRLRMIVSSMDMKGKNNIQYAVEKLDEGLTEGIIHIPNETHSIGEIIKRFIFDIEPDIVFTSYTINAFEGMLVFIVRHTSDPTKIIISSINQAIEAFDDIYKGLKARS